MHTGLKIIIILLYKEMKSSVKKKKEKESNKLWIDTFGNRFQKPWESLRK